ncbi:MAG: hypothetical protein ABI948_07230 [Thermoleophilia bacterium]
MSDVEQLAAQLAEAEAERARTAAGADEVLLTANLEERLRELDGREALGELSAEDAARARGDLQAERDARVDAAQRARRAADYVRARLEEAAESTAKAMLAEPTADWQVAADARQKAAEILAEREHDVTEAKAKLDQAETAADEVRCQFIASARTERAERESRHASLMQWFIRQQNPLALQQLPVEMREEARAEMERLSAESREIRAQREADREFDRLESV